MILWLQLKSGLILHLRGFYADLSYARILLDAPSPEYNTALLAASVELARSLWNEWPVYLMEPLTGTREGAQALPDYRCIGHFRSNEARQPEMDGSGLTIIWFQQSPPVLLLEVQIGDDEWWRFAREY
jgi:hypothetical protein